MGLTGTARPKQGWPPAALNVSENALFNDLYYCVYGHGTLLMRWIDNSEVFLISTVHNPTDFIEKHRRRPRLTNTNESHVDKVWGTNYMKLIKILVVINDYNNHMNGVDVADQRISTQLIYFIQRRD